MNHERLTQRLRDKEGFRRKPYTDTTGHLTIGYGRNLATGITRHEGEVLLRNDIEVATRAARALVANFDDLTDRRQEVLVEMAFNLGPQGLAKFRRTIAAIEAEEYKRAADGILNSKAARQHAEWGNPRYREMAAMMWEG